MSLALELRHLGSSIANLRPDAPRVADDLHELFTTARAVTGDDAVTTGGLKALQHDLLTAHEYARGGAPTGDVLAGVARKVADAELSVSHLRSYVAAR